MIEYIELLVRYVSVKLLSVINLGQVKDLAGKLRYSQSCNLMMPVGSGL